MKIRRAYDLEPTDRALGAGQISLPLDQEYRADRKAFHRRSISDGGVAHAWQASDFIRDFRKIVRHRRAIRETCQGHWKVHRKNLGCIDARVDARKPVEA